ncbi:hypothetical protein D1B31_00820 [Neobacillus notoginsengisoli]|uniref:Uncharacterized protein n=1 Tax=Neobacillus notoginsengisoli TaxID=1578198 RepID=A0A417YZC3_9BACI|nr:hypothetical protein D1B31_00820 [Neobacillus notoginsengisoli]
MQKDEAGEIYQKNYLLYRRIFEYIHKFLCDINKFFHISESVKIQTQFKGCPMESTRTVVLRILIRFSHNDRIYPTLTIQFIAKKIYLDRVCQWHLSHLKRDSNHTRLQSSIPTEPLNPKGLNLSMEKQPFRKMS